MYALSLKQHIDRHLHIDLFRHLKKKVFAAAAGNKNSDLRPLCLDCYLILIFEDLYPEPVKQYEESV